MIFNGKKKQNAIERYERLQGSHHTLSNRLVKESESLLNLRSNKSHDTFLKVEQLFSNIQNLPEEYTSALREFTLSEQDLLRKISLTEEQFSKVNFSEIEKDNILSVDNISVGAGVATGAGVAVFGPSAAIAIATTFGTASTGIAISSLTGAAATTASLAWLGGGAIAAGGSGVAGGYALLALAGPVGCAIAGTSVALFSMNNAHTDAIKINKTSDHVFNVNKSLILSLDAIQNIKVKILEDISSINSLFLIVQTSLSTLNYNDLSPIQRNILIILKEKIQNLAQLIIQEIE